LDAPPGRTSHPTAATTAGVRRPPCPDRAQRMIFSHPLLWRQTTEDCDSAADRFLATSQRD
jgi:hypothetical protein